MSDFSPFDLTPINEVNTTVVPLINNLKKGNNLSMIFLVFLLLFGLYSYVLYLYILEKNQNKIKVVKSDNCIGIKDDMPWN